MNIPNQIAVHPLVLLSVVDHYNRVIGKSKGRKRVVGVLLGFFKIPKFLNTLFS
jgi:26S proteasome regulatory subunit N8